MPIRHAILAAAIVAAGLAAGGATVLADDRAPRRELHVVRSRVGVVIDRAASLRRLDRLLEGIDDIAALWAPRVGHDHARRLRDDDDHGDDHGDERLRGGAWRRVPPPVADRYVRDRLDGMRRELLALRSAVLRAPRVAPAPIPVALPMADRAFARFVFELRRTPFAEGKVALVVDVARRAHFTSAQAAVVVRAIQSWGRVDAAVALHPRVVDPQSFHVVYAALTFSSDRAELRRRLLR